MIKKKKKKNEKKKKKTNFGSNFNLLYLNANPLYLFMFYR